MAVISFLFSVTVFTTEQNTGKSAKLYLFHLQFFCINQSTQNLLLATLLTDYLNLIFSHILF